MDPNRSQIRQIRFLLGTLPFIGVGLLWIFMVHVAKVPGVFLPPLESLPIVIWEMFSKERIYLDILVSVFRVLTGFTCALLLATPLGIAMGYQKKASLIFDPIIGFVRYVPVPVFIPLTLLWVGSGNVQKVVVILLGAFFQLVLMIKDAASSVPHEYYEAALMVGAPRKDLIFRVLWPAALPKFFESYRICFGWAWTYLIVAEIVGATTGIGYYIIKAQRYLLVPQIFSAMFLIGIMGMGTDVLLAKLQSRLFPWEEPWSEHHD